MEVVTVKFDETVLKRIDASIEKHNFNSRTEFIREAVRDKLSDLSREDLIKEFMKFHGSMKGKAKTNLSDREIREQVSKELLAELEQRFK